MSEYGRNLKFWCCMMEKQFFMMLGIIAVVCALNIAVRGDAEFLFRFFPTYLPMMGMIAILSMLLNGIKIYFPQAVSLGGTRKGVFTGMEIMLHGIVLQFLLCTIASMKVLPGYADEAVFFAPFQTGTGIITAVLFLFTCAVGNGCCAVFVRLGTKWGMAAYAFSLFVLILVMFQISLASHIDGLGIFPLFLSGSPKIPETVFLCTGAALMDGVMIVLHYAAIKGFEVKA